MKSQSSALPRAFHRRRGGAPRLAAVSGAAWGAAGDGNGVPGRNYAKLGRAQAERRLYLPGQVPAARRYLPSIPSHTSLSAPSRPAGLRAPPHYSPDQHRRRGGCGGEPGCRVGGDAPIYTPPRGSVGRGRRGTGQPPSPYLVGSAPLSGRAAMNGARPAPPRPGCPAHVRQARGSAPPARRMAK